VKSLTFPLVILLCLPVFMACSSETRQLPPLPETPAAWQQQPLTGNPETLPGPWWASFHDSVLDQLIAKGLANNINQKIAVSRIREARATARNTQSQLFPLITANATGDRAKASRNMGSIRAGTTNMFSAGFDASWEADLFGRLREQRNAAFAEADAVVADKEAVTLSLVAEITAQYTLYRLYQVQALLVADNTTAQEGVLKVTQARYEQGVEGNLEVTRAQTLLETTRAQIPQYQSLAQSAAYQIDYLTGGQPGENATLLDKTTVIPLIEQDVLMETPVAVMQKRPDVLAAQQRLIAATAIKQATVAQLYPNISLSAALGLLSNQTNTFIGSRSQTWTLGGGLTAPIFDFGRIRSNIDASKAREEQAALAFEQTVLAALRDVETAANNYTQTKAQFATLTRAAEASDKAVDIARKQYHEGILSQLDVLQAQQTAYQADNARAQAAANTTQAYIALCKALGLKA
jgi:NodT family efflux transporter outer membrane factor (OMF) lipoprotein